MIDSVGFCYGHSIVGESRNQAGRHQRRVRTEVNTLGKHLIAIRVIKESVNSLFLESHCAGNGLFGLVQCLDDLSIRIEQIRDDSLAGRDRHLIPERIVSIGRFQILCINGLQETSGRIVFVACDGSALVNLLLQVTSSIVDLRGRCAIGEDCLNRSIQNIIHETRYIAVWINRGCDGAVNVILDLGEGAVRADFSQETSGIVVFFSRHGAIWINSSIQQAQRIIEILSSQSFARDVRIRC